MKGGFEVVHGALDLIQPHEQWEYNIIGLQGASSSNFPKPMVVENRSNLERNELSEWVEHVTKQLIEDLPETVGEGLKTEEVTIVGGSFAPVLQWGNEAAGSQSNNLSTGDINGGLSRPDEHGLGLITLLLECAVAISVDNLGEAHRMLLELTQMASPYGASCAERVVSYFAKAMASRVINSWLGLCSPLISHKAVHSSLQIFNNISPFIKFAHFTSNQSILEAFHRRDMVHIIDLDIMQGLQWPALFHILATRIEGPPHIRMTGMGSSIELLTQTGKQLSNFARRLGLSFEFHPVAKKFGEINDITSLQIRRGETLAVHWLQHSLYDATGPDWKTIRLLEELAPRVITLVEQEISHGGSFLDRFVGSLHYYSTIFDSLGASFPSDDPGRHRVEHCLLYREINNIMAIGGPARSGEDKFRQWRSEMAARNCFVQVPMSGNAMAQAQLILNMFPPAHGYSLVQGEGTLRLGWKDTGLYSASAWTSQAYR
ncbi:hypothetical protein VitviT2T_009823 [Vitis vinifera]|uniref:Protein SCARECROW n=2 Tax=Vitis vinifera TaxID=29760 RepID=A0ABY9C957_VITVI|nr:protein SCARECROW [Vitis vinifera]WJZ90695.1 hypothetical protein VitviT2T_009823 [Vitis vinifera]|eukprot:XP_002272465.2 PREDICTED: protein SCARECROW-like [Vitis vinifera]